MDAAGRDATREFDDVGHSGDARARLDGLVIGEVRAATDDELRIARSGGAAARGGKGGGIAARGADLAASWARENGDALKRAGMWGAAAAAVVVAAVAVQRYGTRSYAGGS